MLAYTTGTINEADAGSVGLAMAEQIRDDVASHSAWELVEEFTPGGGLADWYVFKCLATESGLPEDFFVVMGRTLADGELRFAIGENYDESTHSFSEFAPNQSQPIYDSEGRNPAVWVLDTALLSGNNNTPLYQRWQPGGVSTKYWLVVAEDGLTLAFNGPHNEFIHIGAYTPLTQIPIDMPLQIIGTSNGNGAITRNPTVAGQNLGAVYYMQYALTIYGGGSTDLQGTLLGFVGTFKATDALQADLKPMSEQGITLQNGGEPQASALFGWAVGKQKRMRVGQSGHPAGFAFGDAFALNGNLWVPYRPDDGRIWDTGIAA